MKGKTVLDLFSITALAHRFTTFHWKSESYHDCGPGTSYTSWKTTLQLLSEGPVAVPKPGGKVIGARI